MVRPTLRCHREDNGWFTPKRKLMLALVCYAVAGMIAWIQYG